LRGINSCASAARKLLAHSCWPHAIQGRAKYSEHSRGSLEVKPLNGRVRYLTMTAEGSPLSRLPENEVELETLVRQRTDEIAQYLASIVESSDDAILSTDLNGIITSWNTGAERLFGYTFEEAVGKPITILIPPDRQDEEPAILERIRRGERVDHYETIRRRKHGSLLDISLTVSPVRNAEGKIIGASKIARNITERKRREAQITTLTREADHRAKNLLALVQATVQLSQADTPEGIKREIEGRIQALASVVALFAETRWMGAELNALVVQELAPYRGHEAISCRIEGPKLVLEPNTAEAVAMTLHELTTNAAKYGALSVATGRVRVEWSRAADGRLVLRWTETGGPLVKLPSHQGFGTELMEAMIRHQLRGEIRFD
jgi:PAS domain S-box-containing protein